MRCVILYRDSTLCIPRIVLQLSCTQVKSAKPWPSYRVLQEFMFFCLLITTFCVSFFCVPWIVPALGCLGNRQRVTEDFAVLVPVELLTHPVSTLKPVWQPIRKRFLTLPLQMLYQTAVYEEMWGFTTHFEGRREGTSLLIHSVTLLRWEGKNRQDTDGTGRISKQLLTHIQRNTDSGQCWLSVPYAAA